MKKIKFRYAFKKKLFKDISFYHLTLKQIEEGAVVKILRSGMIENGYELIGRDKYTGLKDKNKKEIYERDIVKVINDKGREVEFPEFWCFLNRLGDGNLKKNQQRTEVIGNAYENPELMEKI